MKTAKFLLCENPVAEKSDGRIFILHNRSPLILAEVFHHEDLSESEIADIQQKITTGSRLDYGSETIFFEPLWLVPGDDNDITSQQHAFNVAGIMRRMADWYKSYLIWEDTQALG